MAKLEDWRSQTFKCQDKSRRPPMTIDMPTLLKELMVDGGFKSQCAKYRTIFRFLQQLLYLALFFVSGDSDMPFRCVVLSMESRQICQLA